MRLNNEYTCSICLQRHTQLDACKFTKNLNLTPKRIQAL